MPSQLVLERFKYFKNDKKSPQKNQNIFFGQNAFVEDFLASNFVKRWVLAHFCHILGGQKAVWHLKI